jgi:NAD(P)-dependent dehydrogenase (short-subunit alcohol dehydrogenase family)
MRRFDGQSAFITGAGSGIGRASAEALAREGAHVGLMARNAKNLDEIAASIRAAGGQATVVTGDVADEADVDRAVTEFVRVAGRLDALVTCAAAGPASGATEALKLDDWRRVLDIDLTGVFLSCRAAARTMLPAGYGRIVNLASFHVIGTYPQRAAYVAAKSGVVGLTQALAVEWAGRGVTANAVAPGPIRTPRTSWFMSQDPANEAGMVGRTPSGRVGDLEDVVEVICFLASKGARHVNGQTITVDGGWTKNAWWGKHPWK